jgi:CelD/BcsL family acetyltransferase involved in cellulose biosynthesis
MFKDILGKRFDEKNTFNTVLPMWDFYEELIYPLIIEKKVVLNVVYNEAQPIAMSINFLNDDVLMVSIRTFDVDFNKMNIGNIEIYKLVEWCLENDVKTLDFSKGENYYKKRWTDTEYFYDHHIVYDKNSPSAVVIANGIVAFFKLKQFLRDKNVNSLYTKLKYLPKRLFSR